LTRLKLPERRERRRITGLHADDFFHSKVTVAPIEERQFQRRRQVDEQGAGMTVEAPVTARLDAPDDPVVARLNQRVPAGGKRLNHCPVVVQRGGGSGIQICLA